MPNSKELIERAISQVVKGKKKPVGLRISLPLWVRFKDAVKASTKGEVSANEMVEILLEDFLDGLSNGNGK